MSKNEENTVQNNTTDRRFELMIEGKLSMIGYVMPDETPSFSPTPKCLRNSRAGALPHAWRKPLWNLLKAKGWR